MGTKHELAMADYITETGLALQEMRLVAEGAILLYTNETSDLLVLARSHDQHTLAEAYSTVGCALYSLRDLILRLQTSYIEEIKRQMAPKRHNKRPLLAKGPLS